MDEKQKQQIIALIGRELRPIIARIVREEMEKQGDAERGGFLKKILKKG